MIDRLDKKILEILQQDASLSLDDIGDKAGLSRNACWRRIRKLEEDGVIKGRVAIIDPNAVNLGLSVFMAIRTTEHNADWLNAFHKAVSTIPEIIGAYRTSGDTDYILHARIPDVQAYDQLYQKLVERVALSDVSGSFVMEELKQVTELPLTFV
jgi:Lrp/AsnC family transcriptional regulator